MCEFNSQGIDYIYNHGRLTDITAPHSGSVHYDYDAVGRIAKRWDASGTEEFTYDALGNVIGSTRRMAVPTESNVYVFHTGYKYDSYGRMLRITYPDNESVEYHYGAGGLLADMVSSIYDTICIRQYDERGQRVYQKYGNGTETFYQYSSDRNWLTDLFIQNSSYQFSEKHYTFDPVGNVSSITADEGPSASIASWNATYTYDNRNRLVSGSGPYSYTVTHSPTGKLFRKSFDNLPSISVSTPTGLIYGYDKDSLTHQPRVLYDTVSQSALELFWDADGNLAEMLDCDRNKVRLHRWNDFDRLTLSLGHDFCGYYGYDAEGIRTYKLTGTCTMSQQNGSDLQAQAIFEDMVLYPSPFVTVTPKGYTNHYYAGSERIASRIGNRCWLHDPFVSYEKPSPEWTALEEFQNHPNENYPFGRTNDWSDIQKNTTPVTDYLSEVQYLCDAMGLKILDVMYKGDLLYDIMDCKFSSINPVPVYYYHPDHLGSTSWVTDGNGDEIEFLAYMPYGEPLLDAHLNNYHYRYGQNSARYKFTGKERDAETGYDYIEQRYYWKDGGFWLRPDPLMDKYINLSSYAYCNGNPLKYIDPEGGGVFPSAADLYNAGIEAMNNPNYQPSNNGKTTHCNEGAQAINRSANDTSVKGKANEMGLYLRDPSIATQVTQEEALNYAQQGAVVFASYVNENPKESGHIAVVDPTCQLKYSKKQGGMVVSVFNIGKENKSMTLGDAFGNLPTSLFILNTDIGLLNQRTSDDNKTYFGEILPEINVTAKNPVGHGISLLNVVPISDKPIHIVICD